MPLQCGLDIWIKRAETDARASLIDSKDGVFGKDFDNFITLCENADDVLFSALLLNENHVLHQLLPPVKCTQYNLRNRPHNYTLPKVNNNYIKNNFMFRMLYKNIY